MLYLTLRHYEYICAVAHHGSLSAAAEALNVSQPALSAALARIEDHLGQALFLRRPGAPLILTPQGREFAQAAQVLVDQAAQLESPGSASQATRKLVLGCFSDLAPFLLAPALRCLRQRLPDLTISPRVAGFAPLTDGLLRGEIHLALTYDLGLDAGFSRHILAQRAPQALMAPGHAFATQPSVALADLASEPLILSQEGVSVQHMLTLFKSQGLIPKIAHRAASLELLRSLAANDEGVGVSYSSPPGDLSYDGKPLISVPISDPAAKEPVIIACHGSVRVDSPLSTAIATLAAHFGEENKRSNPMQP